MKAVIQRVLSSRVSVNDSIISSIGRGYLILIGIHRSDTVRDIDWLVKKILNVRLFEDETGKRWSKSIQEKNYEILCVSQFTLYYSLKGNKPEFRNSMKADESREFYFQFLQKLKNNYQSHLIFDGEFGALMTVDIRNDGPVTIELESRKDIETNDED